MTKLKQFLPIAGIIAIIAAIWYYLRGSGPALTQYPNSTGGGLPTYRAPSLSMNLGTPIPAPDPSFVLGPPPALPPTPNYQKFNYAPLNIWNLTPEAAAAVPNPKAKPASATGCCDCGCTNGNCPTFQDGNQGVCVAATKSEQIQGAMADIFPALQFKLDKSVGADPSFVWGQITDAMSRTPVDGF